VAEPFHSKEAKKRQTGEKGTEGERLWGPEKRENGVRISGSDPEEEKDGQFMSRRPVGNECSNAIRRGERPVRDELEAP